MSILLPILKEIGKIILLTFLSEAFIKELIVFFLEWLVKKTDNEVDDELVERIKKAIESKSEEGNNASEQ